MRRPALRLLALSVGLHGLLGAPLSAVEPSDALTTRAHHRAALLPDTLLPDTLPSGTFADRGTEGLVRLAVEARRVDLTGLESYEARMTERLYLGLSAFRFRRERAVFEQERAARVRWETGGNAAIQWLGARRRIPLVTGLAGAEGEIQEELVDDLLDAETFSVMALNPMADRLGVGSGNWALHPLADSALHAYRYASGDTLRLRLSDGRTLTVVEVRVRPREREFHRVAGSLWFDRETGALVRASYRPSRPWSLELDSDDGDGDDVPGFLRPIEAEVEYITVEYGFHDFRWWLPRRFAVEVEARVGSVIRSPLTVEWILDEYEVNADESTIPLTGPPPPGWARSERRVAPGNGSDSFFLTILVPPGDSLRDSPLLSEGMSGSAPAAFSEAELREIRRELEELVPAEPYVPPGIVFGLRDRLVRFNRVEGLSAGVARSWRLGPTRRLRGEARLGAADLEPNVELSLVRGRETEGTRLSLYRRLDHASDWEEPFSLPNSFANVLFGNDRGHFFRTAGAELVATRRHRREQIELRFFAEHQEPAFRETSFHLFKPLADDPVAGNIIARRGAVGGAEATLRWFRGLDPGGLLMSGWLTAEAGGGEWEYNRLAGSVGASHPLPFGVSGAIEAGGGGAWGDVPIQRRFFLGGPTTLRGFRSGDLVGESFWFGRAEIGSRFPAFRSTVFGDAAWAGPREEFGTNGYAAAVGVGFSLLDGLVRFDIARAVRGGDDWRIHLYADALF